MSSSGDYILLSANVSPTYSSGLLQRNNMSSEKNSKCPLFYQIALK